MSQSTSSNDPIVVTETGNFRDTSAIENTVPALTQVRGDDGNLNPLTSQFTSVTTNEEAPVDGNFGTSVSGFSSGAAQVTESPSTISGNFQETSSVNSANVVVTNDLGANYNSSTTLVGGGQPPMAHVDDGNIRNTPSINNVGHNQSELIDFTAASSGTNITVLNDWTINTLRGFDGIGYIPVKFATAQATLAANTLYFLKNVTGTTYNALEVVNGLPGSAKIINSNAPSGEVSGSSLMSAAYFEGAALYNSNFERPRRQTPLS